MCPKALFPGQIPWLYSSQVSFATQVLTCNLPHSLYLNLPFRTGKLVLLLKHIIRKKTVKFDSMGENKAS